MPPLSNVSSERVEELKDESSRKGFWEGLIVGFLRGGVQGEGVTGEP